MVRTLVVSKAPKSKLVTERQSLNIYFISVTLLVQKWHPKEVNEKHLSNIPCIFFTFLVSRPSKFNSLNSMQSSNILYIVVTLLVSELEISILVNLLQLRNIHAIPDVSDVSIFLPNSIVWVQLFPANIQPLPFNSALLAIFVLYIF